MSVSIKSTARSWFNQDEGSDDQKSEEFGSPGVSSPEIEAGEIVEPIYDFSSFEKLPLSDEVSFITVPPTTPGPTFSFENICNPVTCQFEKLADIKIPYIREIGIKACIDILSNYFNCQDYKINPIQFWFLDVITDFLWQMQDEFHFPENYQKIVIEWILFMLNLIRDPHKNLSRKEFFTFFNEALTTANERIQTGCENFPSPEELFNLIVEQPEEASSLASTTNVATSGFSSLKTNNESYIAVAMDEATDIFQLPKEPPLCFKHIIDMSDYLQKESPDDGQEEEFMEEDSETESIEFYQPDLNTPPRFYSSSSSSFLSEIGEEDLVPIREDRLMWKSGSLDKIKKICSDIKINSPPSISEIQRNDIREEWTNYINDRHEYVQNLEKNILINSCLLYTIKQFIYDYFYETFQYTLAKMALMNTFTVITQNLNSEWFIPKVLKKELKRPKEKKKKGKKKKGKKRKPKKKKGKKKSKKSKSKKKSKKGSKKSKKQKKKKLTKEEKAELARLKKEKKRLEEELRIQEENRRLLFPLIDAATDDFFKEIFENWVKPKGKKNKKGKKAKGKKKKK